MGTDDSQAQSTQEAMVSVKINREQVEELVRLGALSEEQAEAGRKAGGLEVWLPARLVDEFKKPEQVELERLAQQIEKAGLSGAARLLLATNRPLSFFGSQLLLMAQPFSRLALGAKDPTGRYSRLLEDRRNVDWLMARLDTLAAERHKATRQAKTPTVEHVKREGQK
jgi:hypothetical protein